MVRFSNLEIIKMLRENARTPFLQMARALGVSETAVRKRVKKLEEEGVIRRYTIEADYRKLGFEVQAFIGVDVKPEHLIDLIEELRGMEEIVSLYSSSGDHMLIAECWFKSTRELKEFVKKLSSTRGVTRVCPAIVLEKVK